MDERERRLQQRRAKRRKNELIMKCLIALLILLVIGLAVVLVRELVISHGEETRRQALIQENSQEEILLSEGAQTEAVQTAGDGQDGSAGAVSQDGQSLLDQAELMAAQYDYDGAMALLQSASDYSSNTELQEAAARFQQQKDACVSYPVDQVTHVFFHTLIRDTSKAFDGDSKEGGYNQVMTTISEFNSIIQQMYDRGYVMVSVHDMCQVNEDGTVSRKEILLPEGKKPFVLSQDDVSYYHYMDGDGFAQKLIVDENGDVKNTYIEDDGSVSVGDYDMVPLIDTFVKEHPDFSYHGHKGIIALNTRSSVAGLPHR